MNEKRKCFVTLATVICILGSSFSMVSARETPRAPKSDGQNKHSWCWATAAVIVAENNGGATLSHTAQVLTNKDRLHKTYYGIDSNGNYTADGAQRSTVIHVLGSDKDAAARDSKKEDALEYASSENLTASTVGFFENNFSDDELSDIQDELAGGNYILANMVYANGDAHSVVLKEYYPDTDQYRIFDPWDRTNSKYSSDVFSSYSFPVDTYTGVIRWVQYLN